MLGKYAVPCGGVTAGIIPSIVFHSQRLTFTSSVLNVVFFPPCSFPSRIMTVDSADEFYSIMGVLTREMVEFGLVDANELVKVCLKYDGKR